MHTYLLRLVNAIKQIRTLDQWVLDINSKYLYIVKIVQMTLFHQVHHKRFVEGLGLKAQCSWLKAASKCLNFKSFKLNNNIQLVAVLSATQ